MVDRVLVRALAAGLVGAGVKSLVDNERFLSKALVADGVVVSVVEVVEPRRTGEGVNARVVEETHLYPVVRFTTTSGQVVQFQAAQNSNPPHRRTGGSISVLLGSTADLTRPTWRTVPQLWRRMDPVVL